MIRWLTNKGFLYFLRIGLMTVLTGFNFCLAVIRWGWSDADPLIKASALIVAGTTEIGLFAFLVLFHAEFYGRRRLQGLTGWGLASLSCVGVSLYVNIGYFNLNWKDAGGNSLADLLIRALFPMAMLLFFSMIPPKKKRFRTQAEIDEEYNAKAYEQQRKNELELLKQQNQRQELDERQARREQRERERAMRTQMLRIAGELAQQYVVPSPGDEEATQMDWIGLQADLEARKLWPPQPPVLATLPDVETLQREAIAAEEAEEDSALTASGKHKVWMLAEDVAKELGIPVSQAALRMEPRYHGRFLPIRSQEFKMKRTGKKVRKAHFEIVAQIKAKEASKVQPQPELITQPRRQRKPQSEPQPILQEQDESVS